MARIRRATPTSDTPRPPRPSIVAAATRIDLTKIPSAYTRNRSTTLTRNWQQDAWDFYDAVPEVQFAVGYVGNTLSKLRLYAAVYPTDAGPDADPIPVTDPDSGVPDDVARAAQAEVEAIASLSGGQAEIIKGFFENTEVAGEVYLTYWAARPLPGDDPNVVAPSPSSWEVHSREEIVALTDAAAPGGKSLYVKTTPEATKQADMRRLVAGIDDAVRIWQRHPRWSGWPTSSIKSCLGELNILQVLSGQVMAESMSRHNAGILVVPTEFDIEMAAPADANPESGPAQPASIAVKLANALLEPITDPSSPASVVPAVLKGPLTAVAGVKHIDVSRQQQDTEGKITAHLVRLAHGLNLPPEIIEGHMETTFANADQIDEDTFDDYLEPRALFLCQSWTFAVVQPNLLQMFPSIPDVVDRIFVWYDASGIISTVDPATKIIDAWDRGLVSDRAGRKHLGLNESDAPSDLERLTRLAFNGVARPTPEVLDALYDLVGIKVTPAVKPDTTPAPIPTETPSTTPPAAADTAAAFNYLRRHPIVVDRLLDIAAVTARTGNGHHPKAIEATASARRRTRPLGERLGALDRDLRTRLLATSSAAMDRAIERATNRSRASIQKRNRVAADAMSSDELFDGAWDGLHDKFMEWGAAAQSDALDLVSQFVSGLSPAARRTIGLRQADDLATAWQWLESTLTTLATAQLLDPTALVAPIEGEVDLSLRVPPGVIRSAMAQAGGATGLHIEQGKGVWLALGNGGQQPAGGIGTGETIDEVLAENGVTREGYVWVYGPGRRKTVFEPHADLDGVEFENFDDDVLANNEGWPEYDFYMPGDHDGCLCDFDPILLTP